MNRSRPNRRSLGSDGFYCDCVASVAWVEARKLNIFCRYVGKIFVTVTWAEDGTAHLLMAPAAENFFGTDRGSTIAYPKKN